MTRPTVASLDERLTALEKEVTNLQEEVEAMDQTVESIASAPAITTDVVVTGPADELARVYGVFVDFAALAEEKYLHPRHIEPENYGKHLRKVMKEMPKRMIFHNNNNTDRELELLELNKVRVESDPNFFQNTLFGSGGPSCHRCYDESGLPIPGVMCSPRLGFDGRDYPWPVIREKCANWAMKKAHHAHLLDEHEKHGGVAWS